jgi:hypothetical protein
MESVKKEHQELGLLPRLLLHPEAHYPAYTPLFDHDGGSIYRLSDL